MKNIIWLVDSAMSLDNHAIVKVMQLAEALDVDVDVIVEKRFRSAERWYRLLADDQKSFGDALSVGLDQFVTELASRFDQHAVKYRIQLTSVKHYLDSISPSVLNGALLVVSAESDVLRHSVFELAKTHSCHILVVTDQTWKRKMHVAAAVDPLHENDRPATLDHELVSVSRKLQRLFECQWSLVHCCFVSPLLIEYKQSVTQFHHDAILDFTKKCGVKSTDTHFLQGVPESVLPDWVKRSGVDILCLGYIARSTFANYLVGSTTYHMLKHPPCDLLLVHQN